MLINKLSQAWASSHYSAIISQDGTETKFNDLCNIFVTGIEKVKPGDIVALIGDFDAHSISSFLRLLDAGAIVVPLTNETSLRHEYFFEASHVKFIFHKNILVRTRNPYSSEINNTLRNQQDSGRPGLIFFTTGTTGNPKGILYDLETFLKRYEARRPPLVSLTFLLFDHIGGINTLFHLLFNCGQVVAIRDRSVASVIDALRRYQVELLPATPTFLRMFLLYPDVRDLVPSSLKIVSYGTERMDQPTLIGLCEMFPDIDFRQTYGMSEVGILRIRSVKRDSLFMSIGGEGVETQVRDSVLYIKSAYGMVDYINHKSPYDADGWLCTRDIVEVDRDGNIKIVGRASDLINIGGLKFYPAEVEAVALLIPGVAQTKATGRENPITGQYLELLIEPSPGVDEAELRETLQRKFVNSLPRHMQPSRITFKKIELSHRLKKS